MNVLLNGKNIEVPDNSRVKDLAAYAQDPPYLFCGALVDNLIKSLEYELCEGESVSLLDVTHEAGYRIYESTLLLMLERAVFSLYSDEKLEIMYALGGGIYCRFVNREYMGTKDVADIKAEMARLVSLAIPINKIKMDLESARNLASSANFANDVELLEYCRFDAISFYELDGFYAYYWSKTLSNTSQAGAFDLIPFDGGCILLGVDQNNPTQIKTFVRQDNLHDEFRHYEDWCKNLGVGDVISLNHKIEDGSITNLITIAEARHEMLITRMAGEIFAQRDKKRIVLIAGPSSAGKTTTSKRLRNHLVALGLNPIAISLDDYFVNRDRTPRDENGQLDFESIEAIDVDLFNTQLIALMDGETVNVPRYNFVSGSRALEGAPTRVDRSSPIIIEGIHGLNDMLTPHIPRSAKYKIYINDLTHLNVDQSNRIPTSDVRLIRRIVRDSVSRGHDALATIAMWQSVKRGESKYIYPFSGEADFVFNSSLLYEMSVLKRYAEPALAIIDPSSVFYYEAQRLLDFLSFFLPVEDESAIYTHSILREFIGGNVYSNL